MSYRWKLALAVLAVPAIYFGGRLTDPARLPTSHFVQYWAAARVWLAGGDPYAVESIRAAQIEAGWPADLPLNFFMRNPPWTLPLLAPFALLSFASRRFAWLLLNLGLLLWCLDRLWVLYGGPCQRRWLAWAVGFTFFPTLGEMQAEQVSPLILTGVVAFLALERPGRLLWAGASLMLLAVKPHLCYLPAAALLVWSVDRRR